MKLVAITSNYIIKILDDGVIEVQFLTTSGIAYSRYFNKLSLAIEFAARFGSKKHTLSFLRSRLNDPLYDHETALRNISLIPDYVQTAIGY